jgi:hypothetical protein
VGAASEPLSCERSNPLVVCEEDDLHSLGDVGEQLERERRALVVEVDEDVVEDERQRIGVTRVSLDRREAQREIELVARAVREALDVDFATRADAHQLGTIFVGDAHREALERT